ncbi:MAG: RES domain-containing protein [Chitinophagaceae bacterium]
MTKETVQNAINTLEAINPSDANAAELALAAYQAIGKVGFFVLDYPALPLTVFRTRTHETDNFFENISEISLPPSGAVKSFARCNVPQQPVFYCSDYRPTSYMELLQYWAEEKTGEFLHVTIGKWRFKNPLKLLIVTSPFQEDRTTDFDKAHGFALDHNINQMDKEMKEGAILFNKYLFDKFRKPAKKDPLTYIITSGYCNLAYTKTRGQIDGLLYPSVPYDGKGVNLAIKPDYDFESSADLILVARDTFKRGEKNGLPSFQQVAHHQAREVDQANKKIIWL